MLFSNHRRQSLCNRAMFILST